MLHLSQVPPLTDSLTQLTFFLSIVLLPWLEHRVLSIAIHAKPVLCIVDLNEVLDQLVISLVDNAALGLVGSEDSVVVEGVIDDGEACCLGENSYHFNIIPSVNLWNIFNACRGIFL